MPGIVGIIGSINPETARAQLALMVQSLHHLPDQDSGSVSFVEKGIHLGWVSHAGAVLGRSVFWNANKDLGLLLTGELFPGELDDGVLEERSLLEGFERMGGNYCSELNGVFSGCSLDFREGRSSVLLFNDRYGLSRVYVCQTPEVLYFASEAKAILRVLPEARAMDLRGLSEQLACGAVLDNRTLFTGISILPPASRWEYRAGALFAQGHYFYPSDWETQDAMEPEEYYQALAATMDRILPKYFRADQALAVSVTGGVDSRIIMAALHQSGAFLPTYTFGGMYRASADVRMGRRVAEICSCPHQVISLDPSFFGEFTDLAQRAVYLTDGTMDVSGAVSLFVHRRARQLAPVRLTGNYGGEILRAICPFKGSLGAARVFNPDVVQLMRRAVTDLELSKAGRRQSFIASKQLPWHHYSRYAIEQSQLIVRTPYLDNELVRLCFRAPAQSSLNKVYSHRYILERSLPLGSLPTDRGTSVTSRTSFAGKLYKLRRWVEEFVPRAEYVYDYGMPHWFAKADKLARPLHLEKLFLGRQKYYHFRLWYARELAQQIQDILLDPKTLSRSFFNARELERVVYAHTSGVENHTSTLHKALSLELSIRTLLEQS